MIKVIIEKGYTLSMDGEIEYSLNVYFFGILVFSRKTDWE